MADLTIRTNNTPRHIVYGYELTAKERAEFDYYKSEEELDDASFFRYKGNVYDLGDFQRIPAGMFPSEWQGYTSDSYFSGVLVRYTDDNESVIVATYYS